MIGAQGKSHAIGPAGTETRVPVAVCGPGVRRGSSCRGAQSSQEEREGLPFWGVPAGRGRACHVCTAEDSHVAVASCQVGRDAGDWHVGDVRFARRMGGFHRVLCVLELNPH